jgi:hypothetical protein
MQSVLWIELLASPPFLGRVFWLLFLFFGLAPFLRSFLILGFGFGFGFGFVFVFQVLSALFFSFRLVELLSGKLVIGRSFLDLGSWTRHSSWEAESIPSGLDTLQYR